MLLTTKEIITKLKLNKDMQTTAKIFFQKC